MSVAVCHFRHRKSSFVPHKICVPNSVGPHYCGTFDTLTFAHGFITDFIAKSKMGQWQQLFEEAAPESGVTSKHKKICHPPRHKKPLGAIS